MLIGVIMIIAGALIALFPELLAIIVASLLIFIGVAFISISLFIRRHREKGTQSISQIFFRF